MNQLKCRVDPRHLAVLGAAALLILAAGARAEAAGLSLEERWECQRSIEEVYWRHRLWPEANLEPRPPLSSVLSETEIRAKVDSTLRQSLALAEIWQRPVTREQLDAEVSRMARATRNPQLLRELWRALGDDPVRIAECLARPQLVDRLVRNWYAFDDRLQRSVAHGVARELEQASSMEDLRWGDGRYSETVWIRSNEDGASQPGGLENEEVILDEGGWTEGLAGLADQFGISGHDSDELLARLPLGRLSPVREEADHFLVTAVLERQPERLRLATVAWQKVPFAEWWDQTKAGLQPGTSADFEASASRSVLPAIAGSDCTSDSWRPMRDVPDPRAGHVAVWTGSEMVTWGNRDVFGAAEPGGRYDPALDVWHPISTTGQPEGNMVTTAVWTGTEMVVWGGLNGNLGVVTPVATGAHYDPITDSWTPTGTLGNVPAARGEHTAVWTGSEMLVWGGCGDSKDCQSYLNSGGRYDPVTGFWGAISISGAPSERQFHTATWTGAEMVVWGGEGPGVFNTLGDGSRYDPASDSWAPMTMNGSPEERLLHTAVASGSEVLIWGGCPARGCFERIENGGGARYDLATDTWSPMSPVDVPGGRYEHTALWTGEVMIVQGGCTDDECSFQTASGGRYDPLADAWLPTSEDSAPRRASHTVVWTGAEMIAWGGCSSGECQSELSSGERYDPQTNSWVPTSTESGPIARLNHSAVWTGTEMILWGGAGASNDGARYDPATDHWTKVNPFGGRGRDRHTAVWTGSEMLVWGGSESHVGGSNSGERYDVLSDSWTAMSTVGAPVARQNQSGVWTGSEMIVWGGCPGNVCLTPFLKSGGRYDPQTDSWQATTTVGAPPGRISTGSATENLAVWTGSEMIVWGGETTQANQTDTGGRYSPSTDSWTPVSLAGAPTARRHHTTVWSGNEMLIWGGEGSSGTVGDGGRYDPTTGGWEPISALDAPSPRLRHAAVWTGSRMIVWGGTDAGTDTFSGGSYDSATDSWTPTDTGAFTPVARHLHTAVWSGREMLVWGGQWRQTGQTDSGAGYCALGGGPPVLTVSGICQESGALEVSGLTPLGNFAIVRASGPAPPPFVVPGGRCAGVELGLDGSSEPVGLFQADATGSFARALANWPCTEALFLQAIDLGSCEVTNVDSVDPQ